MPTSAWRRTAGVLPVAALASLGADYPRPNDHIITSASWNCVGQDVAVMNNNFGPIGAYPAANRAFFVQFAIAFPFVVRKMFWFNGTTAATDSADVGVYTEEGARVVSGGGTAISGANTLQEVDVTDTLLQPGRYWFAYAQNGTTATPWVAAPATAVARVLGGAQMSSAYVLPSTFTPAALASSLIPFVGIASRTLAA